MNLKSSVLSLTIFIALTGFAKAQSQDREAFHAAMEACISETGVTKPERGVHPSEEDRAKIDSCLATKGITKPEGGRGGHGGGNPEFRQAMDACFTETGVTKPERGVRPSDEDRAKIDACLEAKGIEKPQRRGGAQASAQ
jgi:hypothetical protein